jgi:hypothetical protein
MIIDDICQLNLHDSELLKIEIIQGYVIMKIDYIHDYDSSECESSIKYLIFENCENFSMNMHRIFASFGAMDYGDQYSLGEYKKYILKTSTSGITIEIIAESLYISDDQESFFSTV